MFSCDRNVYSLEVMQPFRMKFGNVSGKKVASGMCPPKHKQCFGIQEYEGVQKPMQLISNGPKGGSVVLCVVCLRHVLRSYWASSMALL